MKYRYLPTVLPVLVLLLAGLTLSQNSKNPHGPIAWDCQVCHTTNSWKQLRSDMRFDHDETGFRLDGAHRRADCAGCHKTPVFSHVSTTCIDCHADHHQGQLGTDCSDCHTPRDWEPRQDLLLKHAERGFPLTGVHAVADCESCHHGRDRLEYAGTPTDCQSCHREALEQATDPDHSLPAFRTDCERCHQAAFGTWTLTTYEHPGSFPLDGAHKLLSCSACHATSFAGTPTQCYDCHNTDYASATDPNHADAGFPITCRDCHSTSAWAPATFDHLTTGFPLLGAHATATCVQCHPTSYTGTSSDCVSCHQSDYNGTTDPNHATAGIPVTCADCHSTSAWSPATFDHVTTGFALLGAHATATCAQCHPTSYTGTSSACVACHQSDYNGTTDPSHAAALFPTGCEGCHNTVAWQPANWDHDGQYFPIYSGAHAGRWSNCNECHTVPTDYGSFDCTACHAHNQTDMDNAHSGEVQGYQYLSSACYNCHPRGLH